ncbi:uncharacterized protein LOC127813714 [Diospyros lotus]|uniref:uncharacterized protein LOC127813714 n=1 Tax=Diospyros lotus TaxID=55363 RepID=UPI00224F1411|nr:uncharacterized protein LOC127813714 [Diospyros lotus]
MKAKQSRETFHSNLLGGGLQATEEEKRRSSLSHSSLYKIKKEKNMGHFSFLSDGGGGSSSGDEAAAVEEVLNQAMDHSVLQQVAAINCASFSSDSVLPSHLETRFRRLKSLPATNPPNLHAHRSSSSSSFNSHVPQFDRSASVGAKPKPHPEQPPNQGKGSKPKSGSGSSPSNSSNSSVGDGDAAEISDRKRDSASKSRSRSFLSSPSNLESESPSPSPPKKSGCFWCSPKRVSRKKSKENNQMMMMMKKSVGVDWDSRHHEEELLSSDLGIFSAKEQQKILKKAMKEEEKINREAEKIVKWAKQASARMNVCEIEDELVGDGLESPPR